MKMITVYFKGACCSVLLSVAMDAAPAVNEGKHPKPNIVHILIDDFGWQDPVCFDVGGLQRELKSAGSVYKKKKASDAKYCATLKSLRDLMRNLKVTVHQADNYYLNLYRQNLAF